VQVAVESVEAVEYSTQTTSRTRRFATPLAWGARAQEGASRSGVFQGETRMRPSRRRRRGRAASCAAVETRLRRRVFLLITRVGDGGNRPNGGCRRVASTRRLSRRAGRGRRPAEPSTRGAVCSQAWGSKGRAANFSRCWTPFVGAQSVSELLQTRRASVRFPLPRPASLFSFTTPKRLLEG
jgi:hypothetical protein